jgi:site-specific DNA-methyltransferase (adenine-specific)
MELKDPVHKVWSVPIREIQVNPTGSPKRGRTKFQRIQELAEDIKLHGLIEPVVITVREGKPVLVAGERRLQAVTVLGWTEIDARIIEDLSPLEAKEIELSENVQREDLEWPEVCELHRQIHEIRVALHGPAADGQGQSLAKTADQLGLTEGALSLQLSLARFLQENPEDAGRIKVLPMNMAAREIKRIKEVRKVQRLQKSGSLKLSTDLLHGDALDLIRSVPDGSVDLVLTDPPYGISRIEDGEVSAGDYTKLLKASDNSSREGVEDLLSKLVPELARVMKDGAHIYLFHASEFRPKLEALFSLSGLGFQHEQLVWDKQRTTGLFSGYRFVPRYEPIMFGWKGKVGKRLNMQEETIVSFPVVHPSKRLHPFEKPQGLLQRLISLSSMIGDLVLDPFAGSAAVLVAGRELGRRVLGFEVDEGHWRIGQNRLGSGGVKDQTRPVGPEEKGAPA